MRLRVDVELKGIALLAPGGAGVEFGAVGHDDLDAVIVGMNVGLHGQILGSAGRWPGPAARRWLGKGRGSIAQNRPTHKFGPAFQSRVPLRITIATLK